MTEYFNRLPGRVLSKHPFRFIMGGVFLLLVCGFAFSVLRSSASSPTTADAQWLPAQPQHLENRLGLVGRIEPATHVLLTAPFDGAITELAVTEGIRVDKGQALLKIDTAQLDIQIRQARAEQLKAQGNAEKMRDWENSSEVTRARRTVANSETTLNSTKAKLEETRHLFDKGIVARQEVDDMEERIRSLELELTSSRSELQTTMKTGQGENRQIAEMELANAMARNKTLQDLYEQRELRAPFGGFVLYPKKGAEDSENGTRLQVGQSVKQGMPLFELVNMERIQAMARVEEADLHQLAEKMPVEITGDGFEGMVLKGRIINISSQGKRTDEFSGSTTYDVTVSIDPLTPEQQKQVRIGMSARLSIVTYRAENGIALPAEAVRHDESGQAFVIYRRSMSDPPKQVAVKTGHAVAQGVEVSGMEPGYVELPSLKPDVAPQDNAQPQESTPQNDNMPKG